MLAYYLLQFSNSLVCMTLPKYSSKSTSQQLRERSVELRRLTTN